MKTIKAITNKISFLLLLTICFCLLSQTNHAQNAPFTGTWQYQNGSHLFRLVIWEENEPNEYDNYSHDLLGHYQMSEINGNTETILYTSNPQDVPDNQKFPDAFRGGVNVDGSFSGIFREIHNGGTGLSGDFKIVLLPVCSGCPAKISWEVTKMYGLTAYPIGTAPPSNFMVPTNIELTKI